MSRLAYQLPQICWLCHGRARACLCTGCVADFERLGPHCLRCARPLGQSGLCALCLKKPPAYTLVHSAFVYAPPLTPVIQIAKYGKELTLCRHLGELMAAHLPAQIKGVCLPVPLSPERQMARAYNQSAEIARAFAQARGLRFESDWLWRMRDTAPQVGLTGKARRKNLRDAFLASQAVHEQTIVLIDDVMTTGTTVHEAARALKMQGARSVCVLVAARAHPRSRN